MVGIWLESSQVDLCGAKVMEDMDETLDRLIVLI